MLKPELKLASGAGFEPTLLQSKCNVLPLDDPEIGTR